MLCWHTGDRYAKSKLCKLWREKNLVAPHDQTTCCFEVHPAVAFQGHFQLRELPASVPTVYQLLFYSFRVPSEVVHSLPKYSRTATRASLPYSRTAAAWSGYVAEFRSLMLWMMSRFSSGNQAFWESVICCMNSSLNCSCTCKPLHRIIGHFHIM